MKFTLIAVATLAIAGMANAVHPTHACTKLVDVGATDTLDSIAQKAGVTVDDLLTYNHGLKVDSVLGDTLCVQASKTHAKRCLAEKKKEASAVTAPPASKKVSPKTTAKAPSNAVNHIIPTCNKYATVLPSDADCTSFSKRQGIKESDLYKWNTGLHHAGDHLCDNLDTGKAYCVGVKK